MGAPDPAPKISICIPAYNAAPYLPAAIESALGQTFTRCEVVVSDDASSDNTAEVCARYADARFRAVRSDVRLGQSGNWNRCVEMARGEYVILLHADDELMPRFLERAVGVLDAHPDVGLVHCAVQHVDSGGNHLGLQRLLDQDRVDRDGDVARWLLLDGCVINPAGVLVRRAIYDAVGPFTSEIVWGVDWHMWTRIALEGPVAYLAEPLAVYREHGQSGTTAVLASARNASDELWVIDDVFRQIEQRRPELAHLKPAAIRGAAHRTWCLAEEMCRRGDMVAARAGLRKAVRMRPAMTLETRVWGLGVATYVGYDWFARTHSVKRRLAERLKRPTRR